jgi:hypothetical protein
LVPIPGSSIHLTPIQEYGEKRDKILLSGGKNRKRASRAPGKLQKVSGRGMGGGALREKYYWELIKNDK